MSKLDCGYQANPIFFQGSLQDRTKVKAKSQKSDFQFEGRFLGFLTTEDWEDRCKYFRIHTSRGEYTIQLAKRHRATLGQTLEQGSWIEVSGVQKFNPTKGTFKFKADRVAVTQVSSTNTVKERIAAKAMPPLPPSQTQAHKSSKPQASILICQKSDCVKRGSGNICQALMQALDDRQLSDRVQIKSTGCLKDCKAGPNLVVMPTKTRHSKVKTKHIPAIVAAIDEQLKN
ncbi:(2Fe-2S) ferredoxin domain-containing protein [Tumidithrix elongata RA019]|uniref:(2Fe-2S) ferredoxin domain-containing protein n=1 Tax=Tumidithrix elongata BACA0141 TaxID=2716417 RepID=A0AAW9PR07_9CYAN|nr:(2Fe-2S) ferredoxin domain-containing protein [Tumidithrix elongata RA019]